MAWHDKGVCKVTLTQPQQNYIQANYNRMSTYEMAKNLGLTQNKVFTNMQKMGLKRVELGRNKIEQPVIRKGFFDEREYAKSWA